MRGLFAIAVGASFLALGACSSSSNDAPQPGAAAACTPNAELLATPRDCRSDDQCACGAHCALGTCTSDCGVGAASKTCSAGARCDSFGRCRAADDTTPIPALTAGTPGGVTLESASVAFPPTGSGIVRFHPAGHDLGPTRIVASPGFELQCAPNGAWQAECLDPGLKAGTERAVSVRVGANTTAAPNKTPMRKSPLAIGGGAGSGAANPRGAGQVSVFSGGNVDTLTVQPDGPSATLSLSPGTYKGTARLLRVSIPNPALPTAPDSTPGVAEPVIDVPIQAQLFVTGSSGVVSLSDPMHALNADGKWIGTLAGGAAGTGTIAFGRTLVESAPLTSKSSAEVLGSVDAKYSATGANLTITMNVDNSGMLGAMRTPRAEWEIALTRDADLPAGAMPPAVPADVQPTLLPDAATSPTDWASAFAAKFQPLTAGITGPVADAVLATWQAKVGTPAPALRVDACSPGGRLLAAVGSAADEWRSNTVTYATPLAPASIPAADTTTKNILLGRLVSAVSATYVRTAAVTKVAITAPDGAIPCAVAFDPALLYCSDGTPNTQALQLLATDRCNEIAAEMKCVVGIGTGTLELQAQLDTANDLTTVPCVATPPVQITGTVTKVCTLPSVAWNCGELVSCAADDGQTSYSPGPTPLAVGGDLSCGAGGKSLATLADFNRNQPTNTDSVTTVVGNIVTDFAALAGPAAAPFPAAHGFDAPRQLVALELATEIDRQRAGDPTIPPSAGATRYAARLLQQWATSAALIASEAAERARVPESVQGEVPSPLFPSTKDALSKSLDAWAIVLHPRFASALSAMDGAVLATPDYRADWIATPAQDRNYTETDGLPIALFEALRAELGLVDIALYKASLAGDMTVLPLAGRAVRDAVLVQALARDMYARIIAATPNPTWNEAYTNADRALAAALKQAISRATALELGKNPLGIEDSDLPLYFSGSSVDPAGRFSAISDYLLGSGPFAMMAWAPQAVATAQTAADALATAYKEQTTRQYQAALATNDAQTRLDAIRTQYGSQIANLCGAPPGLGAIDLLEKWPGTFNGSNCYFESELPQCMVDQKTIDALLDEPTVFYNLCVAQKLNAAIPSAQYSAPSLNEALLKIQQAGGYSACSVDLCPGEIAKKCVNCPMVSAEPVTVADLASLNLSDVGASQLADAQQSCRAMFPDARQTLPGADDDPSSPLAHPECYRASLGDLAFTMRSAAKDVEIARSQIADHVDAYNIEVSSCFFKAAANTELDALRSQHNDLMTDLRSAKSSADQSAAEANGAYNCASAITTATGASNPFEGVVAVVGAAAACGAAIAEAAYQVTSIQNQQYMDEAEQQYQAQVALIGEQTDLKVCMNEAHQQLVGIRTAQQQLDAAFLDLEHAQSNLEGGSAAAQLAYDDGRRALATAQGRVVHPPALDAWVDARIDTFVATFAKARLATYLAERAVEYEYQASLAARGQILGAETPAQLSQILSDLRNTSGTLSINGHRPAQLKVVLSLRDHLLQMWDASHASAAEQNLSASERFKLLLRDEQYSLRTDDGKYAGQRIPLSIAPLGALHGDTKGIEIFSTTDCAERIWSVNASILGAGALVRGSQTTFTRMDLLKSNTFFSQACSPATDASPFQVASVRPSRNLFRDPLFGLSGPTTNATASDPTVPDEVTLESRARIQAYFNVPRDKFEDDSYANGETSELAARGLYGDYALFFPAGILSVAQTDAQGQVTSYTDGLDLGQVDDILLRIDYVSVAR
jgi:hypothetical protein